MGIPFHYPLNLLSCLKMKLQASSYSSMDSLVRFVALVKAGVDFARVDSVEADLP